MTLSRLVSTGQLVLVLSLFCLVAVGCVSAQEPEALGCSVDLSSPGQLKDIVSNALTRGLGKSGNEVSAFLNGSEGEYSSGPELLKAAAEAFALSEADLLAQVEAFRHVNCSHKGGGGEENPDEEGGEDSEPAEGSTISKFARDVTLHVGLHELGHALVREFDLPVLGNEETLADAFATYYLTAYLPERAVDAITARVRSLMIEAAEVPRAEWTVRGEHNSDARRASQIVGLALAADPQRYTALAKEVGLSEGDMRSCRDYGTEIHRSWRRLLQPLLLPAGVVSRETRMQHDEGGVFDKLASSSLYSDLEAALTRFDWHSQVTIRFANEGGGAGWNRSRRTITITRDYVQRFVRQGATLKAGGK